MLPFPNAGYVPGPGEMPGYQNLSGYFVPAGTGIPQYQHMQGLMPGLGVQGFKAPPGADLIARHKGQPVSKALPHGQMSATMTAPPSLGPRGPPRGPPPRAARASDTVLRNEAEYMDWLKTDS